jgi:hypothetical protein
VPKTPTPTHQRRGGGSKSSEERATDPLKEDSFIFEDDDGGHGSIFFGVDSDDEEVFTGDRSAPPVAAARQDRVRQADQVRSRARPFSAPGGASGSCIAADLMVREAYRRRCMEVNAV